MTSIRCKLKKKKKEIWTRTEEKLSPHEDVQAVTLAVQGGCAVSILWSFQSPAGQSPEKPGLSRGLD